MFKRECVGPLWGHLVYTPFWGVMQTQIGEYAEKNWRRLQVVFNLSCGFVAFPTDVCVYVCVCVC